MFIKVTKKVLLISEHDMEQQAKYDIEPKEKYWVWRDAGIRVEEIWDVVKYDEDRCILNMYGNEAILVDEPFDILFARLEAIKEEIRRNEEEDEDEEEHTEDERGDEDEE